MSVPLAWSKSEPGPHLPIGMQLAARYGDEATLLRLAGQLEEARPWRRLHPSVWG
jgi:Asp-tRNA(Asn)/Glu-tRNA(Gln) amidotransferase A subunit family amidase